jgi:hypothetical protein
MKNTDEKLQHQLKMQKVREMKNPTILMNTKDLETFIKQVEAQVNNFKVGTPPTYEGLPIIAIEHIEQGNIIIYDDVMRNYI